MNCAKKCRNRDRNSRRIDRPEECKTSINKSRESDSEKAGLF